VLFRSERYQGRLDELPVRWGTHKDLGFGLYRATRPVSQRVVVRWRRPYKEPLFLATDLEWSWRKIVDVFALRMMIEELFRDEKTLRPSHWCSASAGSRKRQMSAFLIGRTMQHSLRLSLHALLQQLSTHLAATVGANWG